MCKDDIRGLARGGCIPEERTAGISLLVRKVVPYRVKGENLNKFSRKWQSLWDAEGDVEMTKGITGSGSLQVSKWQIS